MPRNHASGPATFRNRNRVTNKTRLRVIKGPVEGDPLAFDEDEEKARVVSTAGVDAEDANVSTVLFLSSTGRALLRGHRWLAAIGSSRVGTIPRNC